MEATLGLMGPSWGQWDSVEIVRGQLGVSGGSVVLSGSLWGSVGVSETQWGSVGLSGGSLGIIAQYICTQQKH